MDKRRYLLIVRYGPDHCDQARVESSTRGIMELIRAASAGEFQLAWSLPRGQGFGLFLRSGHDARWIYDELMTPGQHGDRRDEAQAYSSPMREDDDMLVLEIGADAHGLGFGKAITWLQRHR